MFCYAIGNVLLELKFSKANTFTLVACYAAVITTTCLIGRFFTKTSDPSFDWPRGDMFLLVIALGLIMTAGDYFYVAAYTNKGSLMTVAGIVVMFPVFASIVKFAVTRTVPNWWQVAGYACAAIAVALVTKGSAISK